MRPLALLMACSLAACVSTTPPPAVKSVEPSPAAAADLSAYRLGIGDKVRVDVFGEPELSVNTEVDPTGQVSYPLLGSIPALKKTADELQATIAKGLEAGYLKNPDVRVTLVQYRSFFVIGQVNHAGAFPYAVGLTVEKALALAGGLTRTASTRGIFLLHEESPTRRDKVGLDALILPGDTLVVEESLF